MSASRVKRIDFYASADLAKAEQTAEGFLRIDGRISRVGCQTYQNADGTEHVEFRPPDEVFAPESVASFKLLPLTNTHPRELIDDTTAKRHAVGAVGEDIRPDGDFLRTSMLLHDRDAIAAARNGRSQLSAGYSCELDWTPGVYQGEKYDAVQRSIRGNHVALVDVARAGPEARFRLDRMDGVAVSGLHTFIGAESAKRKDRNMSNTALKKITVGDKSFALGQAEDAQRAIDQMANDLTAARAERDALNRSKDEDGDGDELEECDACKGSGIKDGAICDDCDGSGEIEAEQSDDAAKGGSPRNEASEIEGAASAHKDSQSKRVARRRKRVDGLKSAIRGRVQLEVKAREELGRGVKLDGLDDLSVMKLVVQKRSPTTIVDGKSLDYVRGIFDHLTGNTAAAASATVASRGSASDAIRRATGPAIAANTDGLDRLDADAARARMISRLHSAWKQPAPKKDAAAATHPMRPTTPDEAHAAMARRNREAAVRK